MKNSEIEKLVPHSFVGYAQRIRNEVKRGDRPNSLFVKDKEGNLEKALMRKEGFVSIIKRPVKKFFGLIKTTENVRLNGKMQRTFRMVSTVRVETYKHMRELASIYQEVFRKPWYERAWGFVKRLTLKRGKNGQVK